MAYRQILPYTDPLLKQMSAPIGEITPEIMALALDMIDTMEAAEGAGLAAVQVGELVRLCVMIDVPGATAIPAREHMRHAARRVLINPRIVERSEDTISWGEGCLSMPGVFFPVVRHREVVVEYTDIEGRLKTIKGGGYKAICLQHELDHLDGIRNIDRVSALKRSMLVKQFRDHVRRVKRNAQ